MKPLRRVWRIERKDNGYGPWNGFPSSAFDGADVWKHETHPCQMPPPWDDMLIRNRGQSLHKPAWKAEWRKPDEYRYGFPSLGVLSKWCGPRALAKAHENGCVLKVIGADWDRHLLFANQIIFDPRYAVEIRELSLLEVPVELEACQLRQMAA